MPRINSALAQPTGNSPLETQKIRIPGALSSGVPISRATFSLNRINRGFRSCTSTSRGTVCTARVASIPEVFGGGCASIVSYTSAPMVITRVLLPTHLNPIQSLAVFRVCESPFSWERRLGNFLPGCKTSGDLCYTFAKLHPLTVSVSPSQFRFRRLADVVDREPIDVAVQRSPRRILSWDTLQALGNVPRAWGALGQPVLRRSAGCNPYPV